MDLPSWLDLPKIGALGVLVIFIVQYIKAYLPEKYIKLITIGIGVVVAIGAECYTAGCVASWSKTVINGILAAILADGGYSFLSGKGGTFTLPSKPPEPPKP